MAIEQILTFASGPYQLTGTLHLPDSPHPPVVIGCHGLFANRNSPKQVALAQTCNHEGLAYFRFDHRGCGDSQGDFIQVTSLKSRCRDLRQAIQTIKAHPAAGPLAALFGSSFGGTVVLAHAAAHPSPALITYAAPVNSASIQRARIRNNNGHPPAAAMLGKALEFDITPQLKSVHAILIAHSQGDEIVPVDHARRIHHFAGTPKKLILFKNGDHRMSPPAHQQQFETQFIQWVKTATASLPCAT